LFVCLFVCLFEPIAENGEIGFGNSGVHAAGGFLSHCLILPIFRAFYKRNYGCFWDIFFIEKIPVKKL
jgi:hypothetical protein